MSAHALIVAVLLGLAVAVALVSSIGVLVMPDPLQRLHYLSPPTTLSSFLVMLALFIDEPRKQAGIKALFVFVVLTLVNGVVTHATARAARIRELGRWVASADERIPVVGQERYVGQDDATPPEGGA